MPPKTSKYISIFVLIAALLPTLLAFDLPVETPAFSPSSDVVVSAPITGDWSISAPPLSSSIGPSSELNEASSSFPSKSSDLSPSRAPGSPKSAISLPPNAGAPAPESVIVNGGGKDVNSEEPSFSAPSPYTVAKNAPQASAQALINGGGEQGSFDMAPSNANPNVLPFEYRAEDEPVDPYPREETHGGVHGAVAGVMVGVGVVGLAGFVYHKKKNGNNVRAQYQYLGRNNMKKSVSL